MLVFVSPVCGFFVMESIVCKLFYNVGLRTHKLRVLNVFKIVAKVLAKMSELFCLYFQDLGDLEAYRAALKDINDYIARVEREVSTKLETTSRFQNPQEEYKISKVQFQLAAFFALVTANCKKREKVII